MAQTIYRIVSTNPPTEDDYRTYEQMGRALGLKSDLQKRMARGYSCFVSLSKARNRAKGLPWRGDAFIAAYVLADDAVYDLQQTGIRASHYTVWCDASVLKQALKSVVPIRESDDGA